MLAGYDAEGVSEVMGLGDERSFLDSNTSGFAEKQQSRFHDSEPSRPQSSLTIEQAVERGLPRQALRHLAERVTGGDKGRAAAFEWMIVPKTTLERRGTTLSPQESERTERVARLFVHARRALGSEEEAREFLMDSHPELNRRSPVEAARTDLGTRRVEHLLNALEYGLIV